MEWHPVSSSMLESVGYEDGTLHAKYKGGKIYSHPNVPESKFKALLNSPSKGKFFNEHIKPHYPVSK